MTVTSNHTCIHEESIQDYGLQLAELNTKAKYKEQTIMEIKEELKDLSNKIDNLTKDVNTVIQKSKDTDKEIEQRVSNIEKTLEIYEKFFEKLEEDQDKRDRNNLATYAILATLIGVIVGLFTKYF